MRQVWILALGALIASPAMAGKKNKSKKIPVEIHVSDAEGDPISTAVVRHPDEADRHKVNAVTGVWKADTLYLKDGTQLTFSKDTELTFEVSAPGYISETIRYLVRKRKNVIEITLTEMKQIEVEDDPGFSFKRDVPLD